MVLRAKDLNDAWGRWEVSNDEVAVAVKLNNPDNVRKAARELGVDKAAIRRVIKIAQEGEPEPVAFVVTLDGEEISGASPLGALDAACKARGEFIRWQGKTDLCAVDIDVTRPWDRARLYDVAYRAGADRCWLSRNAGGRLVFGADEVNSAYERACAAVVLLDLAYDANVEQVEILAATRRPTGEVISSTSAILDGGSVPWLIAHVEGSELGEADLEAVDAWLEEEGLERGKRAPHTLCPIEPKPTKGDDPVTALDRGVYCFRCAGVLGDGFKSYAALLGTWEEVTHPLVEAARRRVHWEHQRVVLEADWPQGLASGVAKVSYVAILKALGADENEVDQVFDPTWIWLRGEGGAWINPRNHESANVVDALPVLSWTRGGQRTLVAQAKNGGPIPGYQQVRPMSCQMRPDSVPPGVVAISKRNDVRPRRDDVLPWVDAFGELEAALPGIDETYLKALLLQVACAEGGGQICGLVATGTSGSGKTATAGVVANLLGSSASVLRLVVAAESWRRQIGQALSGGCRPLIVNEIDKIPRFRSHMPKLLDLQEPHQWRPLFGGDVKTPWTAPLVLTAIILPQAFEAPELGRRYYTLKLAQKVPDWHGAHLQTWRERGDREARCADSMLAWTIRTAKRLGWSWRACAAELSLKAASAANPEALSFFRERLLALYALCKTTVERDEKGKRKHIFQAGAVPSSDQAYKGSNGWVDFMSRKVQEIIEPLLPDGGDSMADRYWILNRDLTASDWVDIVGERVHFTGHRRGSAWVGRFRPVK